MHQTRQSATTKLPIPRKGTKYVARAASHLHDSVPVVIAVRDMLHLAQTAREVKEMIKMKVLKLNGRPVRDYRESIRLFNLFDAGKTYRLTYLPTGKFTLEEAAAKEGRLCKVMNKRLVGKGVIQLNLHDGSNVLTKEKSINTGDSVYLDAEGKIKKHLTLEKGSEVFVLSGKHQGKSGKVASIADGKVTVHYKGGESILGREHLIAL